MAQIVERKVPMQSPEKSDRYSTRKSWHKRLAQALRFGLVGAANTGLDLLILNSLLWLFPTHNSLWLISYNSLAYGLGAVNSFLLNKYWTFRYKQKTSLGEIIRFIITTLVGIACNDLLIWLLSTFFHPVISNITLWANLSKLFAIFGTAVISYLGMHLWVFVHRTQEE